VDPRLELVVELEQPWALIGAERPLELGMDTSIPIHQRAVTIEGSPAGIIIG
jgi:hypothetical protein